MTDSTYVDESLPPVNPHVLQYHRGDGSAIEVRVAPGGCEKFETRPIYELTYYKYPDTPVTPPPELIVPTAPAASEVYDNPRIGGKFTVCVLLYGEAAYHPLHRRCLDAIISSIPAHRLDLRVGSNALCIESVAYVEQLVTQKIVMKHYRHENNDRKYPVMRGMFYDESCPITTKWLIWFDDDSIANKNPAWLRFLSDSIVANPDKHMFGAEHYSTLTAAQIEFYRQQPWYKGKGFRTAHGVEALNGVNVRFVAGGCWCILTEAIRACDIPARNLLHNGGDICIGEQLHQGGYAIQPWNTRKDLVDTSSVPRRGLSEPHFGTIGWKHLK